MENEADVINVLQKGNMMSLQIVEFANLPFEEQLKIVRNTSVLIGVHGAGLMNILYAADEVRLIKL